MSVADHLKRYPSARPSTLAYLALRDEKLAQLRREIKDAKGWSLPRLLSAVADAFRSWRV